VVFESILIANRAEIASRIAATCRRLGVRSVAVYSEADRDAPFVRAADEALFLGPSEPAASYLRIDAILELAERAGVAAIHPGYGFLAENAAFAEACAARGITFIGPPAAAMRAMGLKHAAKECMERAGVRVLPGYRGESQELARLREAARAVGYPVLIKAVAGGGGKGMRRVDREADFARALESAQREAQAAFGDARVLIERYLTRSRHIEVQVFADRHGDVVHLFERDCSLQRRHQKVLEEAPAPHATPAFQQAIYGLAVQATRAIGYEGAGTIELIADVADGLSAERVYFMEMNTRLQVEHPVTELITGLDLVEWQLRVAAGEPLPRTQAELTRTGHAIEVRLYAEDPQRDYMPQTGRLAHLMLPETSAPALAADTRVRVDAGFVQGDLVSIYYDALLAKLIVWGVDRVHALRQLRVTLSAVEVAGVVTNLALLQAIARAPAFAAGDVHTGFLLEHAVELDTVDPASERVLWTLAAVGRLEARRLRARHDLSPWASTRAFRVNEPQRDLLSYLHQGARVSIAVTFEAQDTVITLPEPTAQGPHEQGAQRVRDVRLTGTRLSCEVQGRRLSGVYVEQGGKCFVFAGGQALETAFWPSPLELEDDAEGDTVVKAPMPGKVHAVLVAVGERVQRGQALLSLEAMKMEHTLRAQRTGSVRALSARVGEQVEEGRTLLVLEADQEA
jgi:3-methylcrotonyl-CoA carboxylase alpha subunit